VARDSFVRAVSATGKLHKYCEGSCNLSQPSKLLFFASKHMFFVDQSSMCKCSVSLVSEPVGVIFQLTDFWVQCSVISFCQLAVLSAHGVFSFFSALQPGCCAQFASLIAGQTTTRASACFSRIRMKVLW
jgi:hypothetical protein